MTIESGHKYGPLDEGTTTDEPQPNDRLRVGREEYDEPADPPPPELAHE